MFADRLDFVLLAKLIELALRKFGGLRPAIFPSIYGGKANAEGDRRRRTK